MKKAVDPNETYEVHQFLACGDGHFFGAGHNYTHTETGECCPILEHEGDPHFYWRNLLVPVEATGGGSLWEKLLQPEYENALGQLPVAL